jgi:hypothetical protein
MRHGHPNGHPDDRTASDETRPDRHGIPTSRERRVRCLTNRFVRAFQRCGPVKSPAALWRRRALPRDHCVRATPMTCQRRLKSDPLATRGFWSLSQHSCSTGGVRMGRRGRKRQLELETEYWQLLKAGVGTVAACRIVGITRKTGYRRRAENGGIPPVRLAETARTSRYLSLLERQRIATLRSRGHGARRSPGGSVGRRPRSAESCAATCAPTTTTSTTATWPRARPPACPADPPRPPATRPGAPGDCAGQAGAGLEPAADRRICAPPTRTAPTGTSATRPSTRRSTTAAEAG